MFKTEKNHPDFSRVIHTELLVVGGGVAGTAAAVAAAREGVRTVLIQNRPVLGGVSSSEYGEGNGACVNGAYNYVHRNARECGIVEEMKNENAFRCENGLHTCWSLVLRDFIEREPGITLLMNTEALSVEMEPERIRSVRARGINSEIDYTIFADNFIDASGDGFFAASGAEYRMGREGKSEFGESLAPEHPDSKTMGSSIAFKAADAGHPVPFIPPRGSLHFESDADLPFRSHSDPKQGYWWLEYGGERDTIRDNEEIYSTLKNILFGLWDHVKNGGDHGAANYAIHWISPITGKRESRRFMGDWILSQNEIMENREFPDAVAYGGWPIDIHPPEGIFSHGHPGSEPPFFFPPTYAIPFRSLYSRNIRNLMMAGRNISVSHVALGSTRVMATCALCGQAVGTAASLLKKYGCSPAELYRKHLAELRILLQKNDQTLPGRPVAIPDDLIRKASIRASSSLALTMPPPAGSEPLTWKTVDTEDPCNVPPVDRRRGQCFPVATDRLDSVTVLFHNRSGRSVSLAAHLRRDVSGRDLASATAEIMPGERRAGVFRFSLDVSPGNYSIILDPVPDVEVCTARVHRPCVHRKADGCYPDFNDFVFEVSPRQFLFGPENLYNDFGRPSETPNLWISDPEQRFPQTLEFNWKSPVRISRLDLLFDTNLDERRNFTIPPECVKAFSVEYESEGRRLPLLAENDNHLRFRRFDFQPVTTGRIILKISETHGDRSARIYGVRAYN